MNEVYMERAIELAKLARGRTSPNPLVGAVIVKNGRIIGEGCHEVYGGPHAEVNAFSNCSENPVGADMYVTLEPCCHYGKTPPCADKIIEMGIKRVIVGTVDPNPKVAGGGIRVLKKAGIEVIHGVMEEQCRKLNEVFIKYITTKRPFVVLKAAMSLDGKIATSKGESRWITGEQSRSQVHDLRNSLTGIMVGVNTVICDDPMLSCRADGGRNPVRIIVDSHLRTPDGSRIIKSAKDIPTIIAVTESADADKISRFSDCGVRILKVKEKEGEVDLLRLMDELGGLKIDSVLLEGGGTLNYSALESGIVDKVIFYIAPKIIGGTNSRTPVEGQGIGALKDAWNIKNMTCSTRGTDLKIEGYVDNGR